MVEAAKEVAEALPEDEANPVARSVVLFTPLILYSLWTLFRTINKDAKVLDFVTGVVGVVVFGNVVSILAFKQRLF